MKNTIKISDFINVIEDSEKFNNKMVYTFVKQGRLKSNMAYCYLHLIFLKCIHDIYLIKNKKSIDAKYFLSVFDIEIFIKELKKLDPSIYYSQIKIIKTNLLLCGIDIDNIEYCLKSKELWLFYVLSLKIKE